MNFAEVFRDAVDGISYTGDELINALRAARALLASLPDDIHLEQKKRFDRQNRRLSGEVIDIPVSEGELSEEDKDDDDEERAERSRRTGAGKGTAADAGAISAADEVAAPPSQFSTPVAPPPAAAASEGATDDGAVQSVAVTPPAGQASNLAASRGGLRDGSGFLSPASLQSRNPLLRSEATSCDASGEPAKTHGRRRYRGTSSKQRHRASPKPWDDCDARHTSSASSTTASSLACDVDDEKRERVRQLELYDQAPSEWLHQFICIGAKLFGEQMEDYFRAVHTLIYYMAVRRKRVEQRCQYLRNRAAQEGTGGVDAPPSDAAARAFAYTSHGSCETAVTAAHEDGATAYASEGEVKNMENSDDNDDEDDELEGFYISREVKRSIRVGLPDNAFRLRDSVHKFFFSCYASVIIQGSVSVAQIKQAGAEVVRICSCVLTWPRYPLNLRAQWADDREEQLRQFLNKWLGEANGHLVTLMMVPPEAPATVRRRAGAQGEVDVDNSTTAPSSPSSVDAESIMADDGNSRHEGNDDSEDEDSEAAVGPNSANVPQQKVFLGPQTRGEDAVKMAYEFARSPAPCSTPLARLVADTVPEKNVGTLLPCIEQPERRTFNDGFCRLAPSLSQKELELITELMQLPLTEMPVVNEDDKGNHDQRALHAAEKAIVKHWASPTYDPCGGELTVLINPTNAFRLQLSNPIIFSLGGVQCDMCCVTERRVSFQAVLDSGVRSEVVLEYEGCIGYDVCVACSYYYYKSSEMRLLRAVHPIPHLRAPFAFGRFSKVRVHSVLASACEESEGDMTVEVVMGVSPYGVMPVGWVLPVDRLAELSAACPMLAEETELTADVHASLPVPPQDWKQRCSIANISSLLTETDGRCDTAAAGDAATMASRHALATGMANDHLIDEADVCPICLQLLHSPLPVLRTLCGHCFHVECIGSHYHYKPAVVDGEVNENNGCPVCRCSDYMPPLTDADAMVRTNVYKLMLRVPADEVAKGRGARAREWGGGCAIAVGTILTDDGAYHNATNIASCEAFYGVMPGFAFTRHATAGAREMEAASPAVS
ncbi:Ring finger domain containing protein, putative [Leishmania donovani]|uniref:Ring finger domain containing protein, putative n=1 Tax=Leishmania donovani TaxID=5661 RepID=A0A3Q8IAL8_LEIDO|nr:Ring finger domain containing protein, putative [Leishmania donovani]